MQRHGTGEPELEQDARVELDAMLDGELEQDTSDQDPGQRFTDAQTFMRDCLALPFSACEGWWADPGDPRSRFVAHPITGRSTFACLTLDERCGQPWYSDTDGRCMQPYDLTALCALRGGRCEALDAGRLGSFCGAR